MLKNANVLIIGARSGGYGESIAQAAIQSGAQVFGTTLNPADEREKKYFSSIGIELIDIPLKFDVDNRNSSIESLRSICSWFRDRQIDQLHSVAHTVAGGFPRHPSVMKAVGDILRGVSDFSDLATSVKRNIFYVNAGSFDDTVKGLSDLTGDNTCFVALTYRGRLPYFISPTKAVLEGIAQRQARKDKNTLIAAFPEAWTQSSQFFTGIEMAVIKNYVDDLSNQTVREPYLLAPYKEMEDKLRNLTGFEDLLCDLRPFLTNKWDEVSSSTPERLLKEIQELYSSLRKKGMFSVLRDSVIIISDYVRIASSALLVNEFLDKRKFRSGDVRQIYYHDLLGGTQIGLADKRQEIKVKSKPKEWLTFDKDEIRKTLSMYGENFLFIDKVVMEAGEIFDGFTAMAKFTVPAPDQNPILKDHFIGMPIFGGHLQMEAVAQFAAFLILKGMKNKRMLPLLTGTEFPDINTLAPPGETLTILGTIRLQDKRKLTLEAVIENRYARSKGKISGMILSERILKKMVSSFFTGDDRDDFLEADK
jgi:3-hydroxymyristoyl/3-hydroxydecanoyl-(acyl carrier protein) dehydratase